MSTPIDHPYYSPELWGGIECTICRVNDCFSDQLLRTGHYERTTDIEKIAGLGVRKLRYPILWERHQPKRGTVIDWTWTDDQLTAIRRNGIDPIAGLLHHGSGPAFTRLDDPYFPELFAAYATMVASRYPWLKYYTPINEPLTTARFSGLYGYWYPHEKSPVAFVKMLMNQLKATVLAMKAIRKINPSAKLVQTEDLARVHSTPGLAYQAAFENNRRWVTFDFLCGKVDDRHPLWEYFCSLGVNEADLRFFLDNICPPDILGLNFYVTSERWLDEDIAGYPSSTIGGNGVHVYADVEAVRAGCATGLAGLIREVYDRYRMPVAVTEVHLSCSREEQLRWLYDCWLTATALAKEAIPVVAVCPWAMLGAYDWDSLLTRQDGHFEAGAFTSAGGTLRITAIGYLVKMIARHGIATHPLLDSPGWWKKGGKALSTRKLVIVGPGDQNLSLLIQRLCCRSIAYVHELSETGIKLTDCWALIELVRTIPGSISLEERCRQGGVPYECINCGLFPATDEGPLADLIDELLDEFIDKVFCMHAKEVLSKKQQIHYVPQ